MKASNMHKPPALKIGDTIGVVAPAWSFDPDNFKKGVDKLCRLGFKLKYDNAIFKKYWSMAGRDKQRAEQINKMFADNEVKAIVCAKAGYGSMRTLPFLDSKSIIKNPKIFVGYSDITAILSYLNNIGQMVVFHGPVISSEMRDDMNPLTLKYFLHAITRTTPIGALSFPGLKSLKPGKAEGMLVGGNFSLIMSLIGTPYDIDTENKILFLEDVGEDLETIDDYLVQLKLAGKFKKVRGIVFGKMVKCVDHSGKMYRIQNVLNDILGDLNIPILYGFPSGHRVPGDVNVTLPLGVSAAIDATDKCRLIINESGVS